MAEIAYENIDLFYYHSIDFDFARFLSILEHGIVSKSEADKNHLKYYYRNYTHSSSKEHFVSVNHFPRTVFSYYQIKNELYDFNTNKICFVIDDIDPLEKQACRNPLQYTNERHVHSKINPNEIKGILLRERDAKKRLSEITFNYKFTDKEYFEYKVIATINFFLDCFGSFGDTKKLYYLLGKYREAQINGMSDEAIIEMISREITKSICLVFSAVLETENPTLLEVIEYLNKGRYPIYLMNRYDIKPVGSKLATTDYRLERFRKTGLTVKSMKEKARIDKKTLKLMKKMTDTGLEIYCNYVAGPLTKEDFAVAEDIKKLSLKK